jgi:hypothetical protein
VEKIFLIEEFFQNYSSTLTNQQKTNIKGYFIELIQILEKNGMIESNYKIIVNGKFYEIDQFTSQNISEGFIIYENFSM